MSTTVVHVVRHGAVQNNEGIFYGRIKGFGLSDVGAQQASNAGKILVGNKFAERIGLFYSSPQQRAQETIGHILNEIGGEKTFTTTESFDEIESPLEGLPISVLDNISWQIYSPENIKTLLHTDHIPYFESFEAAYDRTIKGIRALAAEGLKNGCEVLVTSHGACCLAAKLFGKNIPAAERDIVTSNDPTFYPTYCGIYSLTMDSNGNCVSFSEIQGIETKKKV